MEDERLPSIIFCVEQKVRGHNGYADGDHGEDEKHQQHEAVDIVDLEGTWRFPLLTGEVLTL